MSDPTEKFRRLYTNIINKSVQSESKDSERQRLEKMYHKDDIYDTQQLEEKFEVLSFLAPFTIVKEKKTNKEGMLQFQHYPRFYFDFKYKDGSKPKF